MSKQNVTLEVERTTTAATGGAAPVVVAPTPVAPKRVPQDVEVVPKGRRRSFTAAYKRDVVKRADACQGDGDVGALLRSEGLYSSHLMTWRREVAERDLVALAPRKRGPKSKVGDGERDVVRLRHEVAQWRARAERAELVLEIEKKVSLLLRTTLPDDTVRA